VFIGSLAFILLQLTISLFRSLNMTITIVNVLLGIVTFIAVFYVNMDYLYS